LFSLIIIGGIKALISDKVQDVGQSVTVQVVGIEEGLASKGGKRVIITIS
jgi:hypothetical protein